MGASDHLQPLQFTVLYHGTSAENAASIMRTGLKPADPPHLYPAKWPTTTESRQCADAYSCRGEGDRATVEMHVPSSRMGTYFWPAQEHMGGNAYAVKKTVPGSYVHAVHPVTDWTDYPA
jgi:hypothetical protein